MNIKYVPNILTSLRLVMAVVFVLVLREARAPKLLLALIIFNLAMITDYYDGKIARQYNIITEFGKTMDPLADKLIVTCALLYLSIAGHLYWWITILILLREFGITLYRFYILKQGKLVPAERLGKIKAGFQMGGICGAFCFLIVHDLIPIPLIVKGAINLYFFGILILTYVSLKPYVSWRSG